MDRPLALQRRAVQALFAAALALALAVTGALGTATAQAGPHQGSGNAPAAESPYHGTGD